MNKIIKYIIFSVVYIIISGCIHFFLHEKELGLNLFLEITFTLTVVLIYLVFFQKKIKTKH